MGDHQDPQAEGQAPFFLKAGDNYLWWVEVPGLGARQPLGVYDHPADPDVPFLHSVDVGDNFPAAWARRLTSAVNDIDQWLDDLLPW